MKIFKDLEDFKNQLKINNIGIIIGKHDYSFFKATFIVLFKVLSVERTRVEGSRIILKVTEYDEKNTLNSAIEYNKTGGTILYVGNDNGCLTTPVPDSYSLEFFILEQSDNSEEFYNNILKIVDSTNNSLVEVKNDIEEKTKSFVEIKFIKGDIEQIENKNNIKRVYKIPENNSFWIEFIDGSNGEITYDSYRRLKELLLK